MLSPRIASDSRCLAELRPRGANALESEGKEPPSPARSCGRVRWWTLPFACSRRPPPPPPCALFALARRSLPTASAALRPRLSRAEGSQRQRRGTESREGNGEADGLPGRMGHAGPAAEGRKDTARSEIWVGWERQERGERAGSRERGRGGGMRRWEPSAAPGLGCASPQPRTGGSGVMRCLAPWSQQRMLAVRHGSSRSPLALSPVEPRSQLEPGWSISRKNRGGSGCSSRVPLSISDLLLLTPGIEHPGRWALPAYVVLHPSCIHPPRCALVEVPSQEPGQDAGLCPRHGAEGSKHPCLASLGGRRLWEHCSAPSPWQWDCCFLRQEALMWLFDQNWPRAVFYSSQSATSTSIYSAVGMGHL